MQEKLRGIDLVARYGGGKFVVILPQTDADGTEAVANKILGAVAGGSFFGRIGSVTCSVGIAELAKRITTAGLVKRADLALYDAKQSGRNTYQFYSESLNAESVERLSLESQLRVDDAIFRMTRERAVLLLADVDRPRAEEIVARLLGSFQDRFALADDPELKLGYFEVTPQTRELSVKHVLPVLFSTRH